MFKSGAICLVLLIILMGLYVGGCLSMPVTNPPAEVPPLTEQLVTATPERAQSEAASELISSPIEQPVTLIPLEGKVTRRKAEVSGLAWYGETLIILPQHPDRFGSEGDGRLFALAKADILAFLDGGQTEPLEPFNISLIAPGLAEQIEGFEGYEAITFDGSRAYLTIEAEANKAMSGYLVVGEMAPDLSALTLDVNLVRRVPPQADLENMAYEALLVAGDRLVTLYEANGQAVNPEPVAKVFDFYLSPQADIPFPNLEYRLTDVTPLDGGGRFWAINHFVRKNTKLKPGSDSLVARFGQGPTHARFPTVERLVEFQYDSAGISLTDTPPIQLTLLESDTPRNWEGIARLDERGFLLMTDEDPDTILAFVPRPQ